MPLIKVTDVAYPTLQCPDLDIQEQFLIHFGMHTVSKSDDTLIMRGDGPQQFRVKRNLFLLLLKQLLWKI